MTPRGISPLAKPTASAAKTYVLVHGGYHGGWCWRPVADRLRLRGHTVYTPTLTGLGERSHLASCQPTLQTFIEDVAQVIRCEELSDVILVGHSFAGSVVSALADTTPERLRHLVYLDAQLLLSGESPADRAPPALIESYKERAAQNGGFAIPPADPSYFGITDADLADWLRTKLTAHPLQTYFDRLVLRHPLGNGLPATYIACSRPLFAATASSRDLARQMGWSYREFPSGHDAMLLMPHELAEMLANIA